MNLKEKIEEQMEVVEKISVVRNTELELKKREVISNLLIAAALHDKKKN